MEPLTPGITMVAEATTPTKNNRIMVMGVTVKLVSTSWLFLSIGRNAQMAKNGIKATAPLIPMDFFCVRSSLRSAWNSTGSPPKISPTKVIQVTKV